MGAGDYVRVADGRSICRVQDSAAGAVDLAVLELSLLGGLIGKDSSGKFSPQPGAYLDCTLALAKVAPRQIFATVAAVTERGITVRWTHLEPGDEAKVKSIITAYKEVTAKRESTSGGAGVGETGGTRRVIRPTGPPPNEGAGAGDASRSGDPGKARPESTVSERVGTRRVLKASGTHDKHVDESGPQSLPSPAGDESGNRPVVLTTTDRFAKLSEAPAGVPVSAAPTTSAAALERKDGGGDAAAPTATGGAPLTARTSAAQSGPAPPSGAGGAAPQTGRMVSSDGRMDIGASIRSRSKTVMASELAARHEKVRVLNLSTIKQLIQDAVEEAASHLTRALGEAERKRLLEEAEEGFKERLKAFQLEKASAEERTKELGEQLKIAQDLLSQERKRSIKADQFTVSDQGLVEIDQRMAKTLDRMLAKGGVDAETEAQLRALVATVLDSEREKMKKKELEAQNSKIDLLEKKIKRLASSLDETERQRDEYQSMLSEMDKAGGGLRNIMKAGIKGDDPNKGRKLNLMKTILEENRALREKLGIKLNQVSEMVEQAAKDAGVMTDKEVAESQHIERSSTAEVSETLPALRDPATAAPSAETLIADPAEAADKPAGAEPDPPPEPEINPDDMPWEAAPLTFAGGENEHGVKKMAIANPLDFTPPPLEKP